MSWSTKCEQCGRYLLYLELSAGVKVCWACEPPAPPTDKPLSPRPRLGKGKPQKTTTSVPEQSPAVGGDPSTKNKS